MSPSHVSSNRRTKKSNSNPNAVAQTAVEQAPSIRALADATIAALDHLEAKLDLDVVVRPNDKAQIRALGRVSATAIGLAADVVSADPKQFPHFDAGGLRQAAEYTQAMTRVLDRATLLVQHLQKSILNTRAPASQATLALYATVKGLGRMLENEAMRESAQNLAREIRAPRKKRLTNEQKIEKQIAKRKAERIAKLEAKLAKEKGTTPTAGPTAETPGPKPVAATPPSPTAEVAVTLNGAHPASLN